MIADQIKDAGNLDYMKLSIAAKTYFLLGQSQAKPSDNHLLSSHPSSDGRCSQRRSRKLAGYLEKLKLSLVLERPEDNRNAITS
jgi:hypothetical protein